MYPILCAPLFHCRETHMSRILGALGTAFFAALLAANAVAQAVPPAPKSVTEERLAAARAGVAALGKHWNAGGSAATEQLYVDVHRTVDSSGIQVKSNVSYGPDPQQTLDLYVPDGGFSEPSLVLVYLHGGDFAHGDKQGAVGEGLIYGNVARFIARVGGIGVNANYRLAPAAKWPSGAEDVRLILEWLHKNIAPYGGDTTNIILMGNSVGATHIATYLLKADAQLGNGPGVSAAILASGAFGNFDDLPGAREYFGRHGGARTPLQLVDSYRGKTV